MYAFTVTFEQLNATLLNKFEFKPNVFLTIGMKVMEKEKIQRKRNFRINSQVSDSHPDTVF